MTKCIAVAIVMPLLVVFIFRHQHPYVQGQKEQLKIQRDGITAVADNFEFLTSRLTRPHSISWLGTLTPDRQFSNANIANLKQFTVVLQSVIAPSVLLTRSDWDAPVIKETVVSSSDIPDADIYLIFISDNNILALARQMFGEDLTVNPNGYAYVTKTKNL